MAHARVGIWKLTAGSNRDELAQLFRQEIVPDLRQQAGFVSYLAVGSGSDQAAGVQTWETPEQAVQAGAQIGDHVRQAIGERATLESWFHGPIAIDISRQPLEQARYARIGVWDVLPGANRQEMTEKAREALIPMLGQATGLVSYRAIEGVEGRLVVVHCWESEKASEQGMQSTGQWLQETLANQLALVARYDGSVMLAVSGKQGS
ncbi:MAG TPA: hypothetical protein VFI42_06200 [Thermomicrobiaceae bacterium]|nr:hypothetical protein [Thermomicrobiaceae bacterium]HEX5396238.1 hypothetical protein [Candidatus Limnocylindria bacterium]